MALVTLDFGEKIDLLNKRELSEALAEDARMRATVAGVKLLSFFKGLGTVGPAAQSVTFTGPQSGYFWAVMSLGFEMSAAGAIRIYAGRYSGAADGSNRLLGFLASTATPAGQFSKGQMPLYAGQQLTCVAAANNILSAYMVVIEVPAERIGELLL